MYAVIGLNTPKERTTAQLFTSVKKFVLFCAFVTNASFVCLRLSFQPEFRSSAFALRLAELDLWFPFRPELGHLAEFQRNRWHDGTPRGF